MRAVEIVYIQWVDSESTQDWTELKDASHKLQTIHTVGFLLHQDEDVYLIATTYDPEHDSFTAAIWVPRACVKLVRILEAVNVG